MDVLSLGSFVLAATSEASPPSCCRLWLPVDTLFSWRSQPGSVKLVALQDGDGSGSALPLQSVFGGTVDNPNKELTIGNCCVAAEVWPSHKLKKGVAAVSDALSCMLNSPSPGRSILVYDGSEEGDLSISECSTVVFKLCLDIDPRGVVERGGGRSGGNGLGGGGGAESSYPTSSTGPSTPTAPSPGQRGGRVATPPSMRGAGTSLPSPHLLGMPPQPVSASKSSKKKNKSQAGSDSVSRSQEGATSNVKNPLQRRVVQDLVNGHGDGSKFADVLRILALQTLQNRLLLPGNIITLPFLGLDILLRVEEIAEGEESVPRRVGKRTLVVLDVGDGVNGGQVESETYADKAAKAAADAVGDGDDGPAAKATYQAAIAGMKSLGVPSSELGGLHSQMEVLRQNVTAPLRGYETFVAQNIFPASGLLFYGPPGTGKTFLARAAATDSGAKLFVINGPDIISEFLGESEACLRGIFAAAKSLGPSIIFIDEIDALAPSRSGGGSSHSPVSARLVTTLLRELDAVRGHPVVVLAATNRVDALDESLRRPGRLDKEIEIGVPSPAGRLDILRKMLAKMRHSLSDEYISTLAEDAHGFVGADLRALCSEAAIAALRRGIQAGTTATSSIGEEDFDFARARVRPSALREVALEIPKVSWGDIGGNEEVKQQLKEVAQWPLTYRDSLSRIGAMPPRGVLLYGPPGCSKTLLAKAVAKEAKMNFLVIKGPELYSKYVGESEKALRAAFKKARASCPSIIFFDEIDGMVGSRSDSDDSGSVHVGQRVLSQLLQEMDGLHADTPLIIIAATNRPDFLDPALLRPGRFDRLLYLAPPDAADREAIFRIHTRAMPLDANVSFEHIAAATNGFSGADIAAVCQQAALIALEEDAENVAMKCFVGAIERVAPSIVESETRTMYESFRRKVS